MDIKKIKDDLNYSYDEQWEKEEYNPHVLDELFKFLKEKSKDEKETYGNKLDINKMFDDWKQYTDSVFDFNDWDFKRLVWVVFHSIAWNLDKVAKENEIDWNKIDIENYNDGDIL
jgi:hypothetical protein